MLSEIIRRIRDGYSLLIDNKEYFYMKYIQEYGWRYLSDNTPPNVIPTHTLEDVVTLHLSEKSINFRDNDNHRSSGLSGYYPYPITERILKLDSERCVFYTPPDSILKNLTPEENDVYCILLQHDVPVGVMQIPGEKYTKIIEWIFEVSTEFELTIQTIFLSFEILSRYLHHTTPTDDKLQLYTICAMLIAGKFEEIWSPPIDDYIYISENVATKSEVVSAEREVLECLQYTLHYPTSIHFLKMYIEELGISTHKVFPISTKYIILMFSRDVSSRGYCNHIIAISAIYLSYLLSGRVTSSQVEDFTRFGDITIIKECVMSIEKMFIRSSMSLTKSPISNSRVYLDVARKIDGYYSTKSLHQSRKIWWSD